jgi:protein TonB
MIAKKNPKYDLEKRRKLYLNLGLLVSGSLTLAAFKFGTPVTHKDTYVEQKRVLPEEVYVVEPKAQPEKQVVYSKPEIPPIHNPDSIREVDREPDVDPVFTDKLPDFIDFTEGQRGLGDWGVNDPEPIQTLGCEWVQQYPVFPGGDNAMMSFIQNNYRFPHHVDRYNQGIIYVRFVVSHKGDVTDVAIERGISPELDKEALRVVRAMPQWEPGKHRGRPVNVRMVIPMKIRYQ